MARVGPSESADSVLFLNLHLVARTNAREVAMHPALALENVFLTPAFDRRPVENVGAAASCQLVQPLSTSSARPFRLFGAQSVGGTGSIGTTVLFWEVSGLCGRHQPISRCSASLTACLVRRPS